MYETQCYKCALGQHNRCHYKWKDVFGDFTPVGEEPYECICNCTECKEKY